MKKMENILKNEAKNLQRIYLIYGENDYLINNFIDNFIQKFALKKENEYNIIHLDDTEDDFLLKLSRSITTIPLIARKKIIVVKCDKYFNSAQKGDQKLKSILENINNDVILLVTVSGEIDKRLGVVNIIKSSGKIINFKLPKYRQLDKWIENRFAEQGKKIDKKSIKILEHIFNNQLQTLAREIEKICIYNIDKKDLVYDDIKDVVSRERILADDVVFSLVDAISLRNKKKALILLVEMLADGEIPLRILANIVWQIKLLIQVKELKQNDKGIKEIAQILKMHPYPVEKAFNTCKNFKNNELDNILENLLETNVDIVYGKYSSPELALEMMINKII